MQKFSMGLILAFIVSIGCLVHVFTNVPIAQGKSVVAYQAVPFSPGGALVSSGRESDGVQINQEVISSTLYLPLVLRNFCLISFNFNETIRYNLDKIKANTVWNCYQGAGIVVAVIDTGVDLDHPDLQANLVTGQTFVAGTSSPDDDHGHGSHVAGIVAGVGNNGGIIGVAPRAKVMPIKALDGQGNGSTFNVANGIRWAADHGARVINMSLGSVTNSPTLSDAVTYAYNKGVLLVASAGNCGDVFYASNGCTFQDQPVYPGAFFNVMAVASTDINDNQSSFSNQGTYIEIAAPGANIFSTYRFGTYNTVSGTSQAAPHVAGLAAVIWSKNLGLTGEQVRAQIRNTAKDLGTSGWDSQFGYGRIEVPTALGLLQTMLVTSDNFSPAAESSSIDSQAPFVPGEILFKPRAGLAAADVLDQIDNLSGVKVTGQIAQIGIQKLAVPTGQEEVWLAKLLASGRVEYAELNHLVTLQ